MRTDLDQTLAALDALAAESAAVPARGARGTVADLVARGNAGQQRIPGKHGAPHTSYAAVPVLVPDRPGELARLLHDVGAAGVNLEDLRLEHSQGQPVGLAEVMVLPGAAEHPGRGAARAGLDRPRRRPGLSSAVDRAWPRSG